MNIFYIFRPLKTKETKFRIRVDFGKETATHFLTVAKNDLFFANIFASRKQRDTKVHRQHKGRRKISYALMSTKHETHFHDKLLILFFTHV